MKPLASRALNINVSGLRKMFELAQTIKDPIDLSLGMSDFDIPDSIKTDVYDFIKQPRNSGYTVNAGDYGVRQAVAQKLQIKNKINAKPEEIVITNGATGGLVIALAAILDPGDEIIVFDPYFVLYEQILQFLGAKVQLISTYPNWEIPWAELESKISGRTKAILINTPNNPTGKVLSQSDLEKLAAVARQHDLFIVSDEIYESYVYEGEHFSIGSIYPQTITLMGPSKSAALAGWRIAYAHANAQIIEQLYKLQQFIYVCASRPAQAALASSLQIDFAPYLEQYKIKQRLVKEILGDYPGIEGAFYAFLPAPNNEATEFVTKLIKDKVITVPGNIFSSFNSHFRIAYSVPNEKLEAALKIIKQNLLS